MNMFSGEACPSSWKISRVYRSTAALTVAGDWIKEKIGGNKWRAITIQTKPKFAKVESLAKAGRKGICRANWRTIAMTL
jgi:hypothetical protein